MTTENKVKAFLLFGMGPAGLFLSRQLYRMGYCLYGVGKEDDIGRYSNTLNKYYATESIDSIRAIVAEIIETEGTISAYICSDQYLTMFLEEWPEVFSIMRFEEPGQQLLKAIADKEGIIQFCEKIGLRFPKQYSGNVNEEMLEFPVAVKPNIKRGYSPIPKISILSDEKELITFLNGANQKGLERDELIIQQFIPGDNAFEYGYGGYFRSGRPILDVVFLQLRQYPQGVSCLTCEVEDEKESAAIKELVAPFLDKTQYSGFLQFDIKKHADSGLFYVLDINPRPWGSVAILGPKCQSYSLFDAEFKEDNAIVRWRFPFKEIASFRNSKNVPYRKIWAILPKNVITVLDLYDRKDKMPFFMQLPIAIMKTVKTVRRLIR